MSSTPREIVRKALRFEFPERLPRDLWTLPVAASQFPEALREIKRRFPPDIVDSVAVYRPSPTSQGDQYAVGIYVDEWGCVFTNIHAGVIGEVRHPLIPEIEDWKNVVPPYEILPENRTAARDVVNRFCASSDHFVKSPCCPRPWERYQFLRKSENALMDLMSPEKGTVDLLRRIHEFYLKELEFWVSTEVDAIMFMDDWGGQMQLLVAPALWRELFRPLHKDYCDLAHAHGKFAMMHSDGQISSILEDLVEVGVDALNSQLFCMDLKDVSRRVKGRITFWGEIDRQHVLPSVDTQAGRDAVRLVAGHLYDPAGGLIAQLEFGVGVNPETAKAVFEEWECVDREHREKNRTKERNDE